jgi:hypothetical protein
MHWRHGEASSGKVTQSEARFNTYSCQVFMRLLIQLINNQTIQVHFETEDSLHSPWMRP